MKIDMFQILPEDVLDIIWQYMSTKQKKLVNKENYEKNQILYEYKADKFMRKIIRNDYNYLFARNINYSYEKWRKIKKWTYKKMILSNFIDYLRYLCIENNSNKCKIFLDNYERKNGYYQKKKFKNIKTIRCKWSN
jgi:hypothetical protein